SDLLLRPGAVGGLVGGFPVLALFAFATFFAFGQTAVGQDLVGVAASETDSFERHYRRQLLGRQRASESRHTSVDGLVGVAVGVAAGGGEAGGAEFHPLDVIRAGGERARHGGQRREAARALALGPVASGTGGVGLFPHG